MEPEEERFYSSARAKKPQKFTADQKAEIVKNYLNLDKYGISFSPQVMQQIHSTLYSMDAAPVGLNATTASITTPIQALQQWLPGFVLDLVQNRPIDDLVGYSSQGEWKDAEIVQKTMERTGSARPYTDYGNPPLAGFNINFERRSIVRHELGMTVGALESARGAAIQANVAEAKRIATARELEIVRNNIGFNGFNGGSNRTYGILNEPSLPDYNGTTPWATGGTGGAALVPASFNDIKNSLVSAFGLLHQRSGANIDTQRTPITIGIATSRYNLLSQVTDFGISVMDWLHKSYPLARVVSVPLFDQANGAANVFYMFAEEVGMSGTDDNRTFVQVVPTKFLTLGVDQRGKNYLEDYTNATSGVLLKRAYAVVRYSGI